MPTQTGALIRQILAFLITAGAATLTYRLIEPQQSAHHETPQNKTQIVPLSFLLNTTFDLLNDTLASVTPLDGDTSQDLPDPIPLKWGLPPLFVVAVFIIVVITLYQFSIPSLIKPQPLPPPNAGESGDDEAPPLPPPPQVPLHKKLRKLILLTLLFPTLIAGFYKTLAYQISPPPPPLIIFQNETIPVEAREAVEEISAFLASLLLPDPDPPGEPSGDCKW